MTETTSLESKCRREVVERYCPVIDENTVLIRRFFEDKTVCECIHNEKCKGRDSCRRRSETAVTTK